MSADHGQLTALAIERLTRLGDDEDAAAGNGGHSSAAVLELRGPRFGDLLGTLRCGFCNTPGALDGIIDRVKWIDGQHANEWCLECQRPSGRTGAGSRPTYLNRHDCSSASASSGSNAQYVSKAKPRTKKQP